jgi:hypothetical protein
MRGSSEDWWGRRLACHLWAGKMPVPPKPSALSGIDSVNSYIGGKRAEIVAECKGWAKRRS